MNNTALRIALMKPDKLLKGQPVSLHILDFGTFRVHEGPRVIGLYGYLITTDQDERILIDTGLPAKYAKDPISAGQEDGLDQFGEVVTLTPQNLPHAQLGKAGTSLGDVTLMIQSHTHIDHIGGMDLCPQAPMLINAAERSLPKPLYWRGAQPLDWPQRRYLTLDADANIGPGFDVLQTPGHAPGQMSFLISLPQTGAVLLTSDAISRPGEIDEGFPGAHNPTKAQHSAQRLMDVAKATNALIIYGHCPAQRKTLKLAPNAYT